MPQIVIPAPAPRLEDRLWPATATATPVERHCPLCGKPNPPATPDHSQDPDAWRRPRSMPVFPPRRKPRDPAEEARLERFRRELAELRRPELPPSREERLIRERRAYAVLYRLLGSKSQERLAKESGLSKAALSRVLRGHQVPRVTTAVTLSRSLGIKFSDFWRYLKYVWDAPLGEDKPYYKERRARAKKRQGRAETMGGQGQTRQ